MKSPFNEAAHPVIEAAPSVSWTLSSESEAVALVGKDGSSVVETATYVNEVVSSVRKAAS